MIKICQECKAAGTKSRVSEIQTVTTWLACDRFWDEEGRQHFHDPTDRRDWFKCSNGHAFPSPEDPDSLKVSCGCTVLSYRVATRELERERELDYVRARPTGLGGHWTDRDKRARAEVSNQEN